MQRAVSTSPVTRCPKVHPDLGAEPLPAGKIDLRWAKSIAAKTA